MDALKHCTLQSGVKEETGLPPGRQLGGDLNGLKRAHDDHKGNDDLQ